MLESAVQSNSQTPSSPYRSATMANLPHPNVIHDEIDEMLTIDAFRNHHMLRVRMQAKSPSDHRRTITIIADATTTNPLDANVFFGSCVWVYAGFLETLRIINSFVYDTHN